MSDLASLAAEAREYLRMSGAICWTTKNTELMKALVAQVEAYAALEAQARAAGHESLEAWVGAQETSYKQGWNDREADLIAGADRVLPAEGETPAQAEGV